MIFRSTYPIPPDPDPQVRGWVGGPPPTMPLDNISEYEHFIRASLTNRRGHGDVNIVVDGDEHRRLGWCLYLLGLGQLCL